MLVLGGEGKVREEEGEGKEVGKQEAKWERGEEDREGEGRKAMGLPD